MQVDTIRDNTVTDFDLYIDIDQRPVLYAASPYRWTKDELERMLRGGRKTLYYDSADKDKVEAYRKLATIPLVDLTLPPAKRLLNLTDAAAEFTRVLFQHPLSQTSLAKGQEIAQQMVNCILEDKNSVAALGRLAHHDYYTYYHSSRVAAYALAIALHLSQNDQLALQELAIGCLMHDVGKSKIDAAILNKSGALTEPEWSLMKQHPEFGHTQVEGTILSQVPREIVLHHHERLDGKGYPHGLGTGELLNEVKIAAFADIFDALTTNRPYHASRTRFEALDFIRFKLLSQIDKDAFKAMVEILQLSASTDKPA